VVAVHIDLDVVLTFDQRDTETYEKLMNER